MTGPATSRCRRLITVSQRATPRAELLTVAGEIDLLTAPELREAAMRVLTTTRRAVVIDLTGVSFLGALGLTTLVELADTALHRQVTLRIVVGVSQPIRRPLTLFDLDRQLPVYRTVADALAEPDLLAQQ